MIGSCRQALERRTDEAIDIRRLALQADAGVAAAWKNACLQAAGVGVVAFSYLNAIRYSLPADASKTP